MQYAVVITATAEKDLRKLDKPVKKRVTAALLALADDPRPTGCVKLSGGKYTYRIRVGDYRVIYDVFDDVVSVDILRVGGRGQIY